MSFALSGSNVKGEIYIPDKLWTVKIDESQIQQVINNLVINAHQAMPGGGVIKVSAANETLGSNSHRSLEAGDYVKISVEDQGAGIKEDDLGKIFDPFFSTKSGGHGLGLATSYSIIRKHNGDLCVQSQTGVGSRFDFYLPAFRKESARSSEPSQNKPVTGEGLVLVMDDEESIRDLMVASLGRLGYEVVSSKDGAEAIAYFKQHETAGNAFDLVILDLTIPGGIGGAETISQIRTINADVKAICSSGYSNDKVMLNCNEYGFDRALAKPYRINDLSEALHDLIG